MENGNYFSPLKNILANTSINNEFEFNNDTWKRFPLALDYIVSKNGVIISLEREKIKSNNALMKIPFMIIKPDLRKTGYLYCTFVSDNKVKRFSLHQVVAITFLNHIPSKHNIVVDHIDNNKSNNNVNNLQLVSARENLCKDRKNGTSKFVGVYLSKSKNKWEAAIHIKGSRRINLGSFGSEEEASIYYQNALVCVLNNRPNDIVCKRRKGTSNYKGVCVTKHGKYHARVTINKQFYNFGYFTNEIDAYNAIQSKLNELNIQ